MSSVGTTTRSTLPPRGLPRLPLFGWSAFVGARDASLPCVLDQPHVVFTSSGGAAIALALRDLGTRSGDRVLVPTYHCPTMIAPVAATGATPLFFPLDEAGTPRIAELAKWDLAGVRAMIVAHYFGLPQPMARIRQFCDDRGIVLIEDCAHAMFGEADGRPIGSHGHYAIASLTKFLPTADGGCLVYGRGPAKPPALPARSFSDQIRIIANTVEAGAQHRRMPGVNGMITASFAAVKRCVVDGRRCRPTAASTRAWMAAITLRRIAGVWPNSRLRQARSSWVPLPRGRAGLRGPPAVVASSRADAATIGISRLCSPICRARECCSPTCPSMRRRTSFLCGSTRRPRSTSACATPGFLSFAGTTPGRTSR
jgi:hypothetical protein